MLIEIYTKQECPACEAAKQMMHENHVVFKEYVIGKDVTREEVVGKFPNTKNAPIILVDGREVREVNEFKLLLEG